MSQHANRLIDESSPYLLQHAHNPVDWHPWCEEAFEKARQQDKPVLVSIGYSACHWCHVMERESFENEEIAGLMNQYFINIKVDREERPDVDHIYMEAVQVMTGSGGWPLNVFLTPERKPFFGGTYFPPQKTFNRSSWTEILIYVSQLYREKKEEVEKQASTLTEHLRSSGYLGTEDSGQDEIDLSKVHEAFELVMKSADRQWGGFGKSPKFPQTFTISFLLQYAHTQKNAEALNQAILSLDKMIQGGIYDHLGGGFARYSTDTQWLAPHFEKMLYDNALLVSALADAYLITKKEEYHEVIQQTLSFIERELMHPDGGFYSALDADSEGEEGKFYVWQHEEVTNILKEEAPLFCDFFDITTEGNWEGKNIPRRKTSLDDFALKHEVEPGKLKALLESCIRKLMTERNKRVRPQLDDKVLLGWNALMNISFSKAYAATGEKNYKEVAVKHMDFMLLAFQAEKDLLYHTWKNGTARFPAFLDDYGCLIAALLELYQVTGDLKYLDRSLLITETVVANFSDQETPFFFFTHEDQQDIPIRKKELYDGATPSGNSLMAYNLYRLSILLDKKDWKNRALNMITALAAVVTKYPTSFGVWLSLMYEMVLGTKEITIIGQEWENYLAKILGIFISHKLIVSFPTSLPGYPLLAGKPETSGINLYLCENYACKAPASSMEGFLALFDSNFLKKSTITSDK